MTTKHQPRVPLRSPRGHMTQTRVTPVTRVCVVGQSQARVSLGGTPPGQNGKDAKVCYGHNRPLRHAADGMMGAAASGARRRPLRITDTQRRLLRRRSCCGDVVAAIGAARSGLVQRRRCGCRRNCATVGNTRLKTVFRYCSINWMNIFADLLPKSVTGSVCA